VSVSGDAGDARHAEVYTGDRETGLLHEGHQEPAQAAVRVHGDVVLPAQLKPPTIHCTQWSFTHQ